MRHGLGPHLRGRPLRPADASGGRAALALSLRQALEEGGVTFTKLGQLLSARRDLLPEEFTSELARLQDRAEPAPWGQVVQVITRSLGAPADQVFAGLQPEPAAAASIAQVHKARLRRGDGPDAEVAVKVQRPGIRSTVEQDLDILRRMAVRLERRARWARAVGTAGVARGFAAAMREELDFRVDARNMAAVAATWAGGTLGRRRRRPRHRCWVTSGPTATWSKNEHGWRSRQQAAGNDADTRRLIDALRDETARRTFGGR